MAAFKEAYETVLHANDLIPLLLELGVDVSPTPIRRCRIPISPFVLLQVSWRVRIHQLTREIGKVMLNQADFHQKVVTFGLP
jgi:hypothetical protein